MIRSFELQIADGIVERLSSYSLSEMVSVLRLVGNKTDSFCVSFKPVTYLSDVLDKIEKD